MQMRLELAADAYLKVYIQFDSDGYWQEAANFYTAVKKSFQLPIIPRRCDHFRIKLTGLDSGGFIPLQPRAMLEAQCEKGAKDGWYLFL